MEGRIEERERTAGRQTETGTRGNQETQRDMAKRQMNREMLPLLQAHGCERGRGTQELSLQADLDAPSYWPSGCED